MTRKRTGLLAGLALVTAAGLGAAIAVAAAGSPGQTAASHGMTASPGYSWYRSMMGHYDRGSGTMMGGVPGPWMMSGAGYRWMTGGTQAPGWMRGGTLPGFMTGMMGTAHDPGKIMGSLWASAPGPRVSPAGAARLGHQAPADARVDRAANTVTFATANVRLIVLASPTSGPDETFRVAGLVNPALAVPAGAHVSIQVINADPDTAHGLVVTTGGARSPWMPMMTARPAFPGAALWFLGNPTAAGMHTGTIQFTASRPGTYRYLCPVPGHEQKGMTGTLTVRPAS
jgi:rusticyanin